jgi:hypothetical protein
MINIISETNDVFIFSIEKWLHTDGENITKVVTNFRKNLYRHLRQHTSQLLIDCQHPQGHTKSGNFFLKITCSLYDLSSSLNEDQIEEYFTESLNNTEFLMLKK